MNKTCKLPVATRRLRNFIILGLLCCSFYSVSGQSTDQNFPTAITSNEISGKIAARDIGDARLTSYFYVFNATQGDVFINVMTSNLNGDIDVFTADNLRPLTKITIYADASDSETGRVIYLRQPAKLILRIEGRTPNDNVATYRIKFAGSFAPARAAIENTESVTPTVKSDNQTDVRVNSVGTIIEIKPKPTPTPKEIAAVETNTEKEIKERTKSAEIKTDAKEAEKQSTEEKKQQVAEKEKTAETQNEVKPVVLTTDELSKKENAPTENKAKKDSPREVKEQSPEAEKTEPAAEKNTAVKTKPKKTEKPKSVKPLPPAAMENIRLIILFKDGSKIERPMSDVLKVGVDKGVLTVIAKDGSIGRYSILDVEKMTIE